MLIKRTALTILSLAVITIGGATKDNCECDREFSMPLAFLSGIFGCKDAGEPDAARTSAPNADTRAKKPELTDLKVTFIELGSVNCIPCRMMKPVMEKVEQKYGDQVKVVFYDVMTPEGRPYAYQYGIRGIPTQVFLDKDGNEYFRHSGFFPFDELERVLKKGGVE